MKTGIELITGHYLSTHTFYGSNHKRSTILLRQCGFNVTIANWDAPNVKDHSPIGAVSASNPESNSAAPIG